MMYDSGLQCFVLPLFFILSVLNNLHQYNHHVVAQIYCFHISMLYNLQVNTDTNASS